MDSSRDVQFEQHLRLKLHAFFYTAHMSMDVKGEVKDEYSEKQLTIRSMGWGLGKDKDAKIIAYDLETQPGILCSLGRYLLLISLRLIQPTIGAVRKARIVARLTRSPMLDIRNRVTSKVVTR